MKYQNRSFTVASPGTQEYADRWERTFRPAVPAGQKLADWKDLLPFIDAIRAKNPCGCCWHIILDDGNYNAGAVKFCSDLAEQMECKPCMAFAPIAQTASLTQLSKAAKAERLP